MLSPDPGVCLIHPCKRPVGVCHLCLRDRLIRLSLSGGESSSTLAPASYSSRSSFDSSSCSKHDDYANGSNGVGRLGTIFSLMESDNDEDGIAPPPPPPPLPPSLLRSKSLSQWNSAIPQQPRRSASSKECIFGRRPGERNGCYRGVDPQHCEEEHHEEPSISITNNQGAANGVGNGRFFRSPLRNSHHHHRDHHQKQPLREKSSTPGTPMVQIPSIERGASSSSSRNGGHFSWISSLFRKRKKKSSSSSSGMDASSAASFFPPDGWSDVVAAPPRHSSSSPPVTSAPPPLWRSRSVSSGRPLKKGAAAATPPATATTAATVSSLIAVDLQAPSRATAVATVAANKVVDNALYDMEDETRGSVSSLMDVDHNHAKQPQPWLARSSSTGKWRKKRIRGGDLSSPSSVLVNPAASSEWSFYLTPLRTFRKR